MGSILRERLGLGYRVFSFHSVGEFLQQIIHCGAPSAAGSWAAKTTTLGCIVRELRRT